MICYLHHNVLAHYNSLLSAICKYAVNISCTLSCPRDIVNLHTFTGFTCHHLYCIRGLQSKSKQGEDLVRWRSQAILVKVGFLKTGDLLLVDWPQRWPWKKWTAPRDLFTAKKAMFGKK